MQNMMLLCKLAHSGVWSKKIAHHRAAMREIIHIYIIYTIFSDEEQRVRAT